MFNLHVIKCRTTKDSQKLSSKSTVIRMEVQVLFYDMCLILTYLIECPLQYSRYGFVTFASSEDVKCVFGQVGTFSIAFCFTDKFHCIQITFAIF